MLDERERHLDERARLLKAELPAMVQRHKEALDRVEASLDRQRDAVSRQRAALDRQRLMVTVEQEAIDRQLPPS